MRRLPVYLLLDCSASMTGQPIEQVRQGLRALLDDLFDEPMALETVYLSVITFNSTAEQLIPLTEIIQFKEPQIQAQGTTALGAALHLLINCLKAEQNVTGKRDWKPLVFLMTDGIPTDNWEAEAEQLKSYQLANVIAFAAGAKANIDNLQKITDIILKTEEISQGTIKAFFQWMSQSIVHTGKTIQVTPEEIDFPPPPPHIQIVP
ncbi:VWA domain-containing protein [Candidatus Halobeggiatoa sp. HSG11]|nr:VWA domain-containing protein [Candidatus Halobeggiatoa sp. HSG11]